MRTIGAHEWNDIDSDQASPHARVRWLVDWIRTHMVAGTAWNDRRLVIFTEYEDTRRYLERRLKEAFGDTDRGDERIGIFTGATSLDRREEIKRAFNADPAVESIRILICTDAAREGINLQTRCYDLIHFDLPWNPSRLERLLRETKVETGVLISDKEIRLVHAPRGETSGWIAWPIRPLATVAGRPMLGGLKLLLDTFRLFNDAEANRLSAVLKASRDAQAEVSTKLAEQVLGAQHELLRGLTAADTARIAKLCQTRPDHLYEGLLTVLLRLVFALYAEDRNLLPSLQTEKAKRIYEASYALRSLYAKLLEDQALNPDTMDERRGAWGQLLALFRPIHGGHSSEFIQKRGGKLFDPDAFPFLEGRDATGDLPLVQPLSDGCVLRILEGLITIGGIKGQAREQLSYKTLDVEQIGSVYEIVMGFRAEVASAPSLAIRAGKNNRTPVFVNLEALLAKKGKERLKFLKEEADRSSFGKAEKAIEAATSVAELAAASDKIVDERASPGKRITARGTPDERRRTGSHYTPRSLTEPIVRHALEPAFERLGPDATPEQILDLKVCDPAMGSGAFLVEACRALAARLVEAWSRHPAKSPSSRRTRTRSCTPAASSRSAASTASTRTRSPPISPSCRCGSRRSRVTTSSPSSITR